MTSTWQVKKKYTETAPRREPPVPERYMNRVDRRAVRLDQEAHERRTKEVLRNLAFIDKLIHAEQQTVDRCTCGRHRGIRFIYHGETLLDNACPVDWWLSQSRYAYNMGTLPTFTTTYPFSEYVDAYSV